MTKKEEMKLDKVLVAKENELSHVLPKGTNE